MLRILAFASAFVISQSGFAQTATPTPASPTTSSLASPVFPQSRGNSFNPDIGLNLLMGYTNSNRGNEPNVELPNGFRIQEAELQFTSDVDPYWRLMGVFALHPEFEAGDETATPPTEPTREMVFEVEEGYAESTNLPVVTLKAGKFYTAFGKHNLLHTHAFPFIDAPIVNTEILGHHGFNDVGLSVAALLPMPWYSELTIQGVNGRGEDLDFFAGKSSNDLVGIAHLKNLWDLTDDFTFEFGLSGASGKNSFESSTNILGVDATFKWRPDGRRDQAIIWTTEAVQRDYQQTATTEKRSGFASWVQYQFAQRWWLQARGEYLQIKDQDPASPELEPEFMRKQSLLIGFVPTEFSAVRLQFDHFDDGAEEKEQRVMLQLNYSIGAHPAHMY